MPGADCYCPLLPECGGFAPLPSGLEFCHWADRQPEMSACKASWLVRPNGAEARPRPECPPRGILVCRFGLSGQLGLALRNFQLSQIKLLPNVRGPLHRSADAIVACPSTLKIRIAPRGLGCSPVLGGSDGFTRHRRRRLCSSFE